jgi:hypothetical protein
LESRNCRALQTDHACDDVRGTVSGQTAEKEQKWIETHGRNDHGNVKETSVRSNFVLDKRRKEVILKSKHLRRCEDRGFLPS